MQLRKVRSIPADAGFDRGSFGLKVCNHPDLFETRPTISPFIMNEIVYYTASLVVNALEKDPLEVAEKIAYLVSVCQERALYFNRFRIFLT